jgi:hypothetical protein
VRLKENTAGRLLSPVSGKSISLSDRVDRDILYLLSSVFVTSVFVTYKQLVYLYLCFLYDTFQESIAPFLHKRVFIHGSLCDCQSISPLELLRLC